MLWFIAYLRVMVACSTTDCCKFYGYCISRTISNILQKQILFFIFPVTIMHQSGCIFAPAYFLLPAGTYSCFIQKVS